MTVSQYGDYEQCVACPQFFSPTKVKHVRYCISKGRKRLFDSDCFKLWCDYELNRLFEAKKGGRGLSPKTFLTKYFGGTGFQKFENLILNGDYNREIKNFEVYSDVNEPQKAHVRYYLFASKKLNMVYLGSTQQMLGHRINKHFGRSSVALSILSANDVEFTVLGSVISKILNKISSTS